MEPEYFTDVYSCGRTAAYVSVGAGISVGLTSLGFKINDAVCNFIDNRPTLLGWDDDTKELFKRKFVAGECILATVIGGVAAYNLDPYRAGALISITSVPLFLSAGRTYLTSIDA
jgi:hypothetical protein